MTKFVDLSLSSPESAYPVTFRSPRAPTGSPRVVRDRTPHILDQLIRADIHRRACRTRPPRPATGTRPSPETPTRPRPAVSAPADQPFSTHMRPTSPARVDRFAAYPALLRTSPVSWVTGTPRWTLASRRRLSLCGRQVESRTTPEAGGRIASNSRSTGSKRQIRTCSGRVLSHTFTPRPDGPPNPAAAPDSPPITTHPRTAGAGDPGKPSVRFSPFGPAWGEATRSPSGRRTHSDRRDDTHGRASPVRTRQLTP